MTTLSSTAVPALRGRRILVRTIAWLCCAVSLTLLFGLIDLGTTLGLSDPRYAWSMSLEASWGSLFTFMIGGGFAWIGAVPRRPGPGVTLLGIVAVAVLLGSAILGDGRPLWVAGPLAAITGLLALGLRSFLTVPRPDRRSASPGRAVLAFTGVPLWLGYAWIMTQLALTADPGAGDETIGIDHWPVQVALGIAVALGCAVLGTAEVTARPAIWRELALWRWAFGLTSVFVAWATLAYPDRAGAMPHPAWGTLILLWGLLIALSPAKTPPRGGR